MCDCIISSLVQWVHHSLQGSDASLYCGFSHTSRVHICLEAPCEVVFSGDYDENIGNEIKKVCFVYQKSRMLYYGMELDIKLLIVKRSC